MKAESEKSEKAKFNIIDATLLFLENIGDFTFGVLREIPKTFFTCLEFTKKHFNKLIYIVSTIFKNITGSIKFIFTKIKDAGRAVKVKSVAAYKQGGIRMMFKVAVNVLNEGLARNRSIVVKALNYTVPVFSVAILAIVIAIFSNLSFGLSINYNGESLGCIEHESVYDNAKKQLMQRVLSSNEEDIEIIPQFKLTVASKDSFLNSDQITDELIKASSDVIDEASGLYVDDTFVGAVKDKEGLQNILDGFLGQYKTDDPNDIITFVKQVQIKDGLFPTSSISEVQKINEIISSDTAAEVVYTVVKGDSPYTVAKKAGISLDKFYALNPIAKTTFMPGQKVTISSSEPFLSVKVIKTEVVNESVAYNTITTKNNNYGRSYRKVTKKGKNGVNQVTYHVSYINGIMVEKEAVKTVVVTAPVDEKVTVGTKVESGNKSIASSYGSGKVPKFIWPTSGRISCRWWGYYNHRGLDIAAPKGTPIYAAASGTVISVKNLRSGYGRHLIIDHGNGVQTLYGHTSAIYVGVGEKVSKGELIAAIGKTGWATGYHLHFGVMINGRYYNPEKYLP